jgi:hypothetical protein
MKHDFGLDNPETRNKNVENLAVVRNNPQSARDHIVVNTARLSLEKLKAKTHVQFDVSNVLQQIKTYLENNMEKSQKKDDILVVLQYLARNQYSTNFEETKGLDALVIVWNRIFTVTDKKKRQRMIENLLNELAECIEFGNIVCPSGIITRILDSLNFVDPEVRIVPQWAVRDEMLTKAAKIREDLLKKAPGLVRDALESPKPTPKDESVAKKFIEKFKRTVWDQFNKDYVESGIMTKDMLKTQLSEWIDHIF